MPAICMFNPTKLAQPLQYRVMRDILCGKPPAQIAHYHQQYVIRAGVLVIDTRINKILIVNERAHAEFPGGIISIPKGTYCAAQDKTYLDIALRELYEETGITLQENVDRICPTAEIMINPRTMEITLVYIVLVSRDITPVIRDSIEIDSCAFMSIDEIRTHKLTLFMKTLLTQIK